MGLIMTSSVFLAVAASALCAASAAMADETSTTTGRSISIEQASQLLYYSGGNDRFRIELAPNYSEELGFSMKGAAGGYLTDAMALGLIVEYGADKREYLGNAGVQFNDALSLVGTVGLLEEHAEFVAGEGKDTVRQMEYGASLKGAYEVGVLSGFELNGYAANAEGDSKNVETGKLYGIQLTTDLHVTDTTHVKLGGGYEWLAWDDGGGNDSFAFSAEGTQQLGEMLSINASAKLGASEYVYGGGLALDLGKARLNTNRLALTYSYIDGRDGVDDDQRVELGWSYGFGAGPSQTAVVETQDTGAVRPVADVAMVTPANNLLNDVMARPAFLPQQVIARSSSSSACRLTNYARVEPGDLFRKGDVFTYGEGSVVAYFLPDPGVTIRTLTVTLNGKPARLAPVTGVVNGRPVVFFLAFIEAPRAPSSVLFEASGDNLSCKVRLSRDASAMN